MPVVEVYADVACPFTHVGLRRFVARRAELGRADVSLRVWSWPLELVNGAPFDPEFIGEEVAALRRTVAPDLFTGFDPASFPRTSLGAMDLAHAAYRVDLDTGERVSLALRAALFEDGRDIGDDAVLADIASEFDIAVDRDADRAGVLAEYDAGKARGVRGSPEFFAGGQAWFCPVLDIRHVEGEMVVAVDDATMAAFLTACFAP